jgi:hypothetical protein
MSDLSTLRDARVLVSAEIKRYLNLIEAGGRR